MADEFRIGALCFSRADLLRRIEQGEDLPEEVEDWALMELVKERMANDDGRRIPWREVKARLGL
ncbi:MAG: type II toxin-antitoxin system Phd/YefM family antitoxin [Armatimonadetes bacterium]|nr:type II toxin-antitoxin system Phd/YefM family antitoxin [Armatimonadota bacterium]